MIADRHNNLEKNHARIENNLKIVNPDIKKGTIRFAIFDFDGTISLIRAGWQDIMIPMMVDILLETPRAESREMIRQLVREFVTQTTGKQTIYQMIRLVEEIQKRGGEPREPLEYKEIYHQRLLDHISDRRAGLRNGNLSPSEMVVPGSLDALEEMKKQDVTCFLASGTDENYVLEEAELLGITAYFEDIYGALDDYQNYSKKMVIERIIKEHQLLGPELVAFGDGYVEIENTKDVGGITIGLATDESGKQTFDEWKRQRLIESGADVIMPDFRPFPALQDYLKIYKE